MFSTIAIIEKVDEIQKTSILLLSTSATLS